MEEKEVLVTNDPIISRYTPKSWFKSCLLGFLIGLAIIVPGISGSTISILFKLYDKLLYAISNIFKKFKVCVLFLLPILIGGILGIILGFFSVKKLLEIIPFAIVCLFAGLMCGSAPSVKDEIKGEKFNTLRIILLIIGIALPVCISVLSIQFQNNNANTFETVDWYQYPLCLIIGFIIAITQLIPGLSATAFLMSIGYFAKIMSIISFSAISSHPEYIGILACLGIGFIFGLFIISKIVTAIFKNHRSTAFFMILGFVIGSILTMFYNPDIYSTYILWTKGEGRLTLELSLGIPLFIVGFATAYFLVRYERSKKTLQN